MERKYILAVKPLRTLYPADRLYIRKPAALDMEPYVDKIRFRTLADPKVRNSAVTKWDICTFWKCGAKP